MTPLPLHRLPPLPTDPAPTDPQTPAPGDGTAALPSYPDAPRFDGALTIGAGATQVHADAPAIAAMRQAVDRYGGLLVPRALAPDLLGQFQALAARAALQPVTTRGIARRDTAVSPAIILPLCMALARQPFFDWIAAVTGCPPVAHVEGVLARMKTGDTVGWHRDAALGIRHVAMVIILSDTPHEGGRFELRRKSDGTPLMAHRGAPAGTLALFRIGEDLQHRVTPLTSGGPRLSFSAWARGPVHPGESARGMALPMWPPA